MNHSRPYRIAQRWQLPGLILLLVILNGLSSVFHTRIDLTSEKRFTLSRPVIQSLKKIRQPVYIDVFLKGNLPSGFRQLASSTEDLLREFREVAGNRIIFRFLDPEEKISKDTDITYADSLDASGLASINLTSQVKAGQQQQYIFPYAWVREGDNVQSVILFPKSKKFLSAADINNASALLEFQFAEAIHKLLETEKPVIAYTVGNGEPQDINVYDLVENVLKPKYDLFTFDINRVKVIPENLRLLVMVKPAIPFTDEEKFKLDQYIMSGGKLLLFIDRLDAEMDSLQIKNEVIAYDRDLRIHDMLFRYGVRINPDLVMDLQCDFLPFDVNGNGQYEFLPWNYFPFLQSSGNHPVNKNLGFVCGRFINSLDTVEAEGIRKTILLTSSNNARTIGSPSLISGRENATAAEDARFTKQNIPVAVLLEGRFRSLYDNRISAAIRDTLLRNNIVFRSSGDKESKIIVVADGDIPLNGLVKGNEPIPMGMNPYTYGSQREYPFANRNFTENCIEYLLDDAGLSEAKSKEHKTPLFNAARIRKERSFWQYLNLLFPPALLLFYGLIFNLYRRRKYTKPAKV